MFKWVGLALIDSVRYSVIDRDHDTVENMINQYQLRFKHKV